MSIRYSPPPSGCLPKRKNRKTLGALLSSVLFRQQNLHSRLSALSPFSCSVARKSQQKNPSVIRQGPIWQPQSKNLGSATAQEHARPRGYSLFRSCFCNHQASHFKGE